MTKKDYIKIAEILNKRYYQDNHEDALPNQMYKNAVADIVEDLSWIFREDNDRFNVDKFSDAVYTRKND